MIRIQTRTVGSNYKKPNDP